MRFINFLKLNFRFTLIDVFAKISVQVWQKKVDGLPTFVERIGTLFSDKDA